MKRKLPPEGSCQRQEEGNGWFMCHRCSAFWFGRIAPEWRPPNCLTPPVFYDTEYVSAPCASCGERNNMAAALNAMPKPGDFALCFYCGHITVFALIDDKLTTREPTHAEMIAMAGDPKLIHMQELRHAAYTEVKKRNTK